MKWLIKKYMAEAHIDSIEELSEMTGITRRLLYIRMNEPGTIKASEIRALDDVLHFGPEDLVKLARGQV